MKPIDLLFLKSFKNGFRVTNNKIFILKLKNDKDS